MKDRARVEAIEAIVGHVFKDKQLVISALTHPSAAEGQSISASYERLEFLGDSILGSIVANDLFTAYPELDEGELTKRKNSLVSGETLSRVAQDLGIAPLIVMGESELGTGARGMHSALENVYEALVGALFLDEGIAASERFVLSTLVSYEELQAAEHRVNPKSLLQELTQKEFHCMPEYKLAEEKGPAHSPTFTSVVLVEGKRVGRGSGPSKKLSESAAAQDALSRLGYTDTTQRASLLDE